MLKLVALNVACLRCYNYKQNGGEQNGGYQNGHLYSIQQWPVISAHVNHASSSGYDESGNRPSFDCISNSIISSTSGSESVSDMNPSGKSQLGILLRPNDPIVLTDDVYLRSVILEPIWEATKETM